MKTFILILFFAVPVFSLLAQADTADYDQLVVNASSLLKEGKLDDAKEAAQQAIKLDQTNYLAYAVAAKIASKQNDLDDANNFVQKALELAPNEDKDKVRQLASEIQSAASPSSELSDQDRLTYDELTALLDQADQATTPEDQDQAFREFLNKSSDFVKSHPNQMKIWEMRAMAAMDLNLSQEGWEAGQHIKALSANGDDPNAAKILAELDLKGWLGELSPQAQAEADHNAKRMNFLKQFAGTWEMDSPSSRGKLRLWITESKTLHGNGEFYMKVRNSADGSTDIDRYHYKINDVQLNTDKVNLGLSGEQVAASIQGDCYHTHSHRVHWFFGDNPIIWLIGLAYSPIGVPGTYLFMSHSSDDFEGQLAFSNGGISLLGRDQQVVALKRMSGSAQ